MPYFLGTRATHLFKMSGSVWQLRPLQNNPGWLEGEHFIENAEVTELLSRGHKAQSVVCERGFDSKVS